MNKVIGVVSGKGGVGKTTACVNLGLAMHKLGKDVVVVDGDLKNPNFGLHLGGFDYPVTINDAIKNDLHLTEAIHKHKTGMKFIPAHLSLHYLETEPQKLGGIIKKLDSTVIVDSPPGLEEGALSVLDASDEIITVTAPYLPDLTDSMKTLQVAREMNVDVGGVVLNSVRGRPHETPDKEIEETLDAGILKKIPWDENVLKGMASKTPVVERSPYSPASIAFFELASELTGLEWERPRFLGLRRFFSLG